VAVLCFSGHQTDDEWIGTLWTKVWNYYPHAHLVGYLIPHSAHQVAAGGRCTMPQDCISSFSFMLIGSFASCQCSKSTIELHTVLAGRLR